MIGAGWKDMISSYRSSFSCSRLMSSLCTMGKGGLEGALRDRLVTHDRIQRTRGRGVGQQAHLLGRANAVIRIWLCRKSRSRRMDARMPPSKDVPTRLRQ